MRLAECHGSIHHLPCAGPCSDALWFSHAAVIDRDAVPVRIDPDAPEVPRREDVSIAGRALAASHAIDEALGRE
ncbi:hypothetical protein ACPOLB_25395 [Rubrivivax sp. RP6-9]|uniref:hypothetical protein n=1 Tax=Rubrivivax sp. RP6-9 TaxID=3415750 RepID=UPI003CC6C7E3